jgi:hypothetical protein
MSRSCWHVSFNLLSPHKSDFYQPILSTFFFFQNRNFSGYIVCFELPTHSLRKLSTSKKNVDVFSPSTISSTQTKKNAQFFFCPGLERSSEIGLVSTQSHHRIINFFFFYEIVTLNTNINLDNSSTISLYLTVV